jgi:two-component system chemotaxis response regulator CheB
MSIRVIVVDDSATMRGVLTAILRADPAIEVVGQAADPIEARAAIKALHPDVITLDIEMPHMDGLEFLEKIMRLRPMPVIMVSSLTHEAADITLQAMEMGAFDCVAKAHPGHLDSLAQLPEKVKAAARSKLYAARRPSAAPDPNQARGPKKYVSDGRVVAIGSSTGGVEALMRIIPKFPVNCPPTLITQHMPPTFLKRFAARLNGASAATVEEAYDGAPIKPGHIYLAPGDAHLELYRGTSLTCRLTPGEPVSGHMPSVDAMFTAVVKQLGRRAIGVILTGMGRDGADGMLALRRAGAETLGQNEATSLVYGMPRAAFEAGGVAQQLPLEQIADRLLHLSNTHAHERVP